MRKSPYLFSQAEYMYLHQVFLKAQESTKLWRRIKEKKGVDLDKSEIDYVKRRFMSWCQSQDETVFLPEGVIEEEILVHH